MSPGWVRDFHVYPHGDYREHVLSRVCWCNPALQTPEDGDAGGYDVIHHSMDGRESYEQGRKLS